MPRWRIKRDFHGLLKSGGIYRKAGDFIAYTPELEKAGYIESVPGPEDKPKTTMKMKAKAVKIDKSDEDSRE